MFGNLMLSEAATAALRLAATQRPSDAPLTTGIVLAALARADAASDWQRLWLHSGQPDDLHLADAPDTPDVPSSRSWENVPLSPSMASALSLLERICSAYRLAPASTGLLALAVTADPASGAAAALARAGLPHAQLLDIIQSDLIGSQLAGLDSLISSRPSVGDRSDPVSTESAPALLLQAESRATGRPADEMDLLAVLASQPESGVVLDRLGLDDLPETCEKAVRAIGLTRLADVARDEGRDAGDDGPLRLMALLAASPSAGLSWLFRLAGVNRTEVAAEAMEAIQVQAGHRRVPSTTVVVLGVMNVIFSLLVSVLIVINAVGPGSLWELLLVPVAWLGYPRWPSAVALAAAVPIALAVTPVAGAAQLATGIVDWLDARAERQQVLARTGVVVTRAAARRIRLRQLQKGRMSLMLRQVVRMRYLVPRLLRAAARADHATTQT